MFTSSYSNEFGELRIAIGMKSRWYSKHDVCRIIGINKNNISTRMIKNDSRIIKCKTNGGIQSASFINEHAIVHMIQRASKDIDINAIEWIKSHFDGDYIVSYRRMEHVALDTIEQLLNVKLERQYPVLGYRIDGYDKENNIAYEIDEKQHNRTVKEDKERQLAIENELNCTFVRIAV